jgi:hypothetical protein
MTTTPPNIQLHARVSTLHLFAKLFLVTLSVTMTKYVILNAVAIFISMFAVFLGYVVFLPYYENKMNRMRAGLYLVVSYTVRCYDPNIAVVYLQ